MDINKQKRLTSGKGWKQVIVDHAVGEAKKAKAKAKRIWGGIKATPAVVKKTFKDQTTIIKNYIKGVL